MAHVQKRQRTKSDGTPGAVVWCLRYINPETGKERTETFRRKRDAERRLTEVEASKLTGSYVDPRAGQVSVGVWAERWFDVQVQLKPTTRARYRSILDVHVIPRWAEVDLARVRHADVQKWVAELAQERSAATVRKVHRVLSQVLGSAVRDGRLVRNVAEGVALPRVQSKERRYPPTLKSHNWPMPARTSPSASTRPRRLRTGRPIGCSCCSSPIPACGGASSPGYASAVST